MKYHRLFKIEDGTNVIVFVPTLQKIYRVSQKMGETLPSFVTNTEEEPSINEESKGFKKDYQFERLVLILTNRCNLNCLYCYGNYNSNPAKPSVMPINIALAAIDYTLKCITESKKRRIRMGIFGGEPTLAWNTLVEIVNYFRFKTQEIKAHSTINITTNGCMDDNKVFWLVRNMDSILLSIDGFKDIHNIQRSRSFDRVFATAKIIYSSAPQKLKTRTTISAWSVNYLSEIVQFLGENFPGCTQMYEPLFEMGRGRQNFCKEPPKAEVFFEKFLQAIPIAKRSKSSLRTSVLGLGRRSGLTFCGVAGRNFMITYDGRITACNRMVDESINKAAKYFCYGRFDPRGGKFVFDDLNYQKLKKLTVDNIPDCRDCFARFSCKGDCPANKATIWPQTFWNKKSYRCEAIRKFTKGVLSYILDHGQDGLVS